MDVVVSFQTGRYLGPDGAAVRDTHIMPLPPA